MWKPPSPADEPLVELFDWSAFLIFLPALGLPSVHLVGINLQSGRSRVTSPVARVHVSGTRFITSSGRIYDLVGPSGSPDDCRAMMGSWLTTWNAKVLENVTATLTAMSEQVSGALETAPTLH